jgi:hypothetical protein
MEVRSCNHCCSVKAISITDSEGAFVALGIQHVLRVLHVVICGLPRSAKVFHIFLFFFLIGATTRVESWLSQQLSSIHGGLGLVPSI